MKFYILVCVLTELVTGFQYNQPCTFSLGTCTWSIGRRWHIINLTEQDRVLVADGESKEDKRVGFTDAIMSPWLTLSSLCSFDVRLTFQFSIPNERDLLEIYLTQENRTRLSSIGQWTGLRDVYANASDEMDPLWQRANVTFKATEKFRIDIEVRHVPENETQFAAWFAIDDILIENCPTGMVTTESSTDLPIPTTTIVSTSAPLVNANTTASSNTSHWLWADLPDEHPSSRLTLVTLVLYLLCALIALTLLLILLAVVTFTYRKHCSPSVILGRHAPKNRIGIQIENIEHGSRADKTLETTVRSCF